MNNKDLVAIFDYMEREKGIKRDVVVAAISESLQAAAKKSYHGSANLSVEIDPRTGQIDVLCEKEIVDEVEDPLTEISLVDAHEIDSDAELGQFIDIEVTPKNFGRIAAQTARQIIAQKLRSAERDVIYEEYRHRVGEIVSGTVKRFARGINLVIDLGKVEALMPARHYPKTEKYYEGDRVQALLYAVQDLENGGAEVILSRTDGEFVRQLFQQEVPEVHEGTVTLERIVREPGYRTKVAVASSDPRVDAVGTCVGVRGTRVKSIVRELSNEKVDIIPFTPDPVDLLERALDPVEIRKIGVNEEDRVISIVVDDESYPTVIGRRGMNARLNGALIGYELEALKMSEYTQLLAVERKELAASDSPALDERLELPGISSLLLDNLIDAGHDTPRKVLECSAEELATVGGLSTEMTDRILSAVKEKINKAISSETEVVDEPAQEQLSEPEATQESEEAQEEEPSEELPNEPKE